MLHTISAKSYSALNFSMLLENIYPDDAVIFTAGALVHLQHDMTSLILEKTKAVYVYDHDVRSRGLVDLLPSTIKIITMDEWVELTTHHTQIHAWP